MRARSRRLTSLLCPLLLAAGASLVPFGSPHAGEADEAGPRDPRADHRVRTTLQNARGLRREGRLEHAAASLRRGLRAFPDEASLHFALGMVLRDLGDEERARRHLDRADALSPPPPPPPATPHEAASEGLVVVLVPPDARGEPPSRYPSQWPRGGVGETLERRLRTRLPDATLIHAAPDDVAAARRLLHGRRARAAISLRVDRAYCDETLKDGPFAVAWIRAAAEVPGERGTGAETWREVVSMPRGPSGCRDEAVSRAFEGVLSLPGVRHALSAPEPRGGPLATAQLRSLFPAIGRRIEAELAAGRLRLAAGRVGEADAAFRRALAIDPEDDHARAYVGETEATLALVRELGERRSLRPSPERPELDARVSDAQRAATEALLAEEQRRRADLLAALAVLDEDVSAPTAATLARLRPSDLASLEADGAVGPRLARERAGGEVEARAAWAPDGSLLARYYFPKGSQEPVLREEDTNEDGRPNRWIGYEAAARREIIEAGGASGRPDRRFVFAPGGTPLERIEVDGDGDGRPERVFLYAAGVLSGEQRDTNGDGALDRHDRLDPDGSVSLREEDLDGDGEIDVRSVFRAGKLVRRELRDPERFPAEGS